VGDARSAITVNEVSEDPAEISPSVEMDHPLQVAGAAGGGSEDRVETAPTAEVDVAKVSGMSTGGHTLSREGDWDATDAGHVSYTFTIAPDTEITSGFNPGRNPTGGQLRDGYRVGVQINSNGKNTSFATSVEGEHPADISPSVEMDHPL